MYLLYYSFMYLKEQAIIKAQHASKTKSKVPPQEVHPRTVELLKSYHSAVFCTITFT